MSDPIAFSGPHCLFAVEVPAVKLRDITSTHNGESSAQIRERVMAARQR